MTAVGIYVDGPNLERGLHDAGEMDILERIGSLLVEFASTLGGIIEAKVFLDEATQWRSLRTKEDYEANGFQFVESKSFKHVDPHTHSIVFGKSLTDPSMHCAIVDRLHDLDCPDVFVIATGDKDITVALDYIHCHGKSAQVLGEANSISGFLVSKCDSLNFGCHVIQLLARTSKAAPPPHHISKKAEAIEREELRITEPGGRPVDVHNYVKYRNDRSNQMNPNNLAYWRSRGFAERPPDWEKRWKKEQEETAE
jgi:hypothetical protein